MIIYLLLQQSNIFFFFFQLKYRFFNLVFLAIKQDKLKFKRGGREDLDIIINKSRNRLKCKRFSPVFNAQNKYEQSFLRHSLHIKLHIISLMQTAFVEQNWIWYNLNYYQWIQILLSVPFHCVTDTDDRLRHIGSMVHLQLNNLLICPLKFFHEAKLVEALAGLVVELK